MKLFRTLSGFYGMVGPNLPIPTISSLYSLFTGNGVIQGVFIENGIITPVRHILQTEKRKYPFDTHLSTLPFYLGLHTLKLFPNPIGVANTAFLHLQEDYVLFERDLPYQIHIDSLHQTITTVGRKQIPKVTHLSGHTKVRNHIHSLEYSIVKKKVSILTLSPQLELLKRQDIKTNYIPLVHDFAYFNHTALVTDSPMGISIPLLLQGQIPIVMKPKPTFIHHVTHDRETIYTSNRSFFIFHYADVVETNEYIDVYAAVYYQLNFSTIHIHGIYSKLRLDKQTRHIHMETTPELEGYNLDFPVKWKEYILLRNIRGRQINGFVVCKGLEIYRKLWFALSICGEPSIVNNTLMCIGYDTQFNAYFIMLELETNEMEQIPLNWTATLGFHSTFF